MKFSIRDLMLVTGIVALALGWWVDHRRLIAALVPQVAFGLTPNGTPTPTLDLEFKQGSFPPTATKAETNSQIPPGLDGQRPNLFPHGQTEGVQRVVYKGDKETFEWQEAIGQQVNVEGIAWGSMEKGYGEYVIMNDAKVFVDPGGFLSLGIYGRAVSVSGILRLKTVEADPPLEIFVIEDPTVVAIEKVKWPWMSLKRTQ